MAATHPVQMALSGGKEGMQAKLGGPTFFTERSLAAYLAVSDRTVRNWIRRGELPSYKLGASRRIDPADLELKKCVLSIRRASRDIYRSRAPPSTLCNAQVSI